MLLDRRTHGTDGTESVMAPICRQATTGWNAPHCREVEERSNLERNERTSSLRHWLPARGRTPRTNRCREVPDARAGADVAVSRAALAALPTQPRAFPRDEIARLKICRRTSAPTDSTTAEFVSVIRGGFTAFGSTGPTCRCAYRCRKGPWQRRESGLHPGARPGRDTRKLRSLPVQQSAHS